MADTLNVTQEDREAATGLIGSMLNAGQREALLAGKSDTLSIVQAFAHHRLTSAPKAPNDSDLRDALIATCDAEIAKYTGTHRSDNDIRFALNGMRKAILATLEEKTND